MSDPSRIAWQRLEPGRAWWDETGREAIRYALEDDECVTGMFLDAASSGEPLLLAVNDPHRATQTRKALRELGRLRGQLRVRPRFRAIVATGTHRFRDSEKRGFENTMFLGCGLKVDEVTWHDAREEASHAEIGGVRLHRWVVESRRILAIGSVEPHYFAGLGGPHKTMTIGCMAWDDIERNHRGALEPESDVLRLAGNPVYDDVAAVVGGLESAGKNLAAIALVQRGKQVVTAAAGHPLGVLDELVDTVELLYVGSVSAPVDVLHLRVPPPLGRNFYQADKGIKNNQRAVRDGGGILLEAECREAIGPDAFMNLLKRAPDYGSARAIVEEEGYRLGDHKAVKLRHLTDPLQRGVHVAVVSSHLTDEQIVPTGCRLFPAVESALAWLGDVVGDPLERGLIVEDAGVFCTAVGEHEPERELEPFPEASS